MKKLTCTLEIELDSEKQARDSLNAISQETEFAHRGGSKVERKGKMLRIEMTGDDPVSLRATINSYFRLMQILKTVDGVE